MVSVVSILRAAHLALFIAVALMVVGAWKVRRFAHPNLSVWWLIPYTGVAIIGTTAIGVAVHAALGVKTPLSYRLGVSDYPRYRLI